MKHKIIMALVGAGVVSVASTTALAHSAAKPAITKHEAISDDVVKIAVLTNIGGLRSDHVDPGATEAARMAITDFGGKMLGKSIELVFANHQNKADIGSARMREWIDWDGVDMISERSNSGVALVVARIAQEKERLFLDVGAATASLTDEDCNPCTVRYGYDTSSIAKGIGSAMVKHGGKSWYFLTADYTFSQSLESRALRPGGSGVI